MRAGTGGDHDARPRVPSRSEVSYALRKTQGDRTAAAAALGITKAQVEYAIKSDDQLRALWGAQAVGGEVPLPTAEEIRMRTPSIIPNGSAVGTVDLGDIVSENDTNIMRLGLKKMGASESLLKSLKQLDKLAESGGKFLAVSLQTTHRMHFVQTIASFELADRIKKLLDADDAEADPEKKLSHEDRMGYFSLYLEMQDATGKAYTLTLKGTESMVRMMMAASKRGYKGKAAKPGFAALKSENANGEENPSPGED